VSKCMVLVLYMRKSIGRKLISRRKEIRWSVMKAEIGLEQWARLNITQS